MTLEYPLKIKVWVWEIFKVKHEYIVGKKMCKKKRRKEEKKH